MSTKEIIKKTTANDFSKVLDELCELVKIPSVSSDTFDQTYVLQSAKKVESMFAEIGGQTEILSVDLPSGWKGRPAVVAHFPALTNSPEEAPTVLLYAHHDVQPGGLAEAWETADPFKPVVKNGRLYGRGSSDDGAGIAVHYGALRALGNERGVNVTVFIEGEEEVGSPSFTEFLKEYKEKLAADLIVVTDSDNWRVGQPAITTTLRGMAAVTVSIQVLDHALHSGMYGGPVIDAVTIAARLIATLHDEEGSVAIEGLSSNVKSEVDYPEEQLREDMGLLPDCMLTGRGDLASRMWTQPAICVTGFDATSVANASNTLAPRCKFSLSLRVAPGQDCNEAKQLLINHLKSNVPFGAKISFSDEESGPGYQAKQSARMEEVRWALENSWGVAPVEIGVGGSIPFIADFQKMFPKADVVVTGVEDPATNAHSENESQDLGDLEKAITAEALLLAKLGGTLESA
ncbi:dipeptidase [Actinomycetaceae bacterium TAE3-ERU4]|nr:dipeptidase [Actinomycetaceae bacterium TAE3-ERU4]